MSLEIRPYRPEEVDAFLRVPAIVFGNYALGPRDPATVGTMAPEWSLAAFEDGELATTYGAFPFVMRLDGAKAPVAGVTFVGTLPWFRRRGHLRRIMEFDFKRRYEERLEPIAVLLASIAAIYQRYGYAVCSGRYSYSIDPKLIAFAPSVPSARGTWREASHSELPLLQSLYREFSAPRNGYLHRAPVIWEGQVLATAPAPGVNDAGPSLIAVYEEGGVPRGYIVYGAKSYDAYPDGAGPGQRVFVRDYVWLTPSAYRALWQHLSSFDLARRIVIDRAPVDDPAFDVMLDPRELHATKGDWLLGRIIDLERALPLRPYGHKGRVTFEVRDEMCPWNAGRWALDAAEDGASVARTKEAPQITLDVSALAQLLFGEVSPRAPCATAAQRRRRTPRSPCGTRCGGRHTRPSARTCSSSPPYADQAAEVMMKTMDIPAGPDQLSAEWLTDALRRNGAIAEASVAAFDPQVIAAGTGFIGQLARVSLAYDRDEPGAPRSLIAKFPAASAAGREIGNLFRFYEREIRFYDEIADRVEMRTPRRYHSAMDIARGEYVLLLEDLAPARCGDQLEGCGIDDARLAVRELAKFHAAWWQKPELASMDWMLMVDDPVHRSAEQSYAQAWQPFVENFAAGLSKEMLAVAERVGRNVINRGSYTSRGRSARIVPCSTVVSRWRPR